MVYLVVAIGQFGVILLATMAKAAGLIVGTTALLICVATASAVALHATWIHLASQWSKVLKDEDAPIEGASSPAIWHRRPSGRASASRKRRRRKPDT